MAFRKMLPVVLLVSLLAVPAAAQAKFKVGLGEQDSSMFASARWQSLKLKRTRYLVPWNWTADASARSAVTAYMTRARAAHQQVLVGRNMCHRQGPVDVDQWAEGPLRRRLGV